LRACALLLAALAAAAPAGGADPPGRVRVAWFHTELSRQGPGLLLHDIRRGDPQVAAVVEVIAAVGADVLALGGIDYDAAGAALSALAGRLAAAGAPYPHRFALRPNTGMATGLDLDGDGRTGGRGDAQGWGAFAGQGGLAILSRWPVDEAGVRDLSGLLWADVPGALLPETAEGGPFPSAAARAAQRLSTTGHWIVPLVTPAGGRLTLMVWMAAPPVFDGPEDRNGRRNHDEARLWTLLLDGALPGEPPPAPPFVILGLANLDPEDGEGRPAALATLLADPRVRDPAPESPGAAEAALRQGGPNLAHRGPHARDTADLAEDGGPGNLRLDLLLPSADLGVAAAGVLWPVEGAPLAAAARLASRHRLVWADLSLPGP
jgi:hypothetical protein